MTQVQNLELGRMVDIMLSRPIAYERKDVVGVQGKHWLYVHLGGKNILFPLVNVGTQDDTTAIAWFNPNPEVNPELSRAAAKSMADLLRNMKPRIIVTVASSKSGPFIAEAARRYNPAVKVVTLLGGDSRAEVAAQSVVEPVAYLPVTRLASNIPKYMGMTQEMRWDIMRMAPDGYGMVIVDDVATTGNSIKAAEEVTGAKYHQIAVVARESELEGKPYPVRLPSNMRTIMYLPEMKYFPVSSLYPSEPKSAIPQSKIL